MYRISSASVACAVSVLLALDASAVSAAEPSPTYHAPVEPAVMVAPKLPDIGEEMTIADLIQPARFGWPARFICRRFAGEAKPLRVVGANIDDLNGKLEAMDVAVEDCRGGFSIRSLKPQPGKLDQIIGNAQ
ncbi:MAG TPA: hypothetical protein VGD08_24685 [Stellaceae bacterium]